MSASCSDLMSALDALSPVDGRYQAAAAPLRALLSERALVLERIRIEAQWVLQLAAAVPQLPGAHLSPAVLECARRSEEHTSELQSQSNLVCRLLLEKKT